MLTEYKIADCQEFELVITRYANQPLIEALKKRCVKAFKVLYDKYSGALYSRVNKMMPDASMSQDILQNSFIKMWQNIEAYDEKKATLFTWMLSICRHEVIDYYRSQKSIKRVITAEFIKSASTVQYNSAPDKLEINYYLMTLKPLDRAMMELIYFQGFTQAQTARLLSIPEGTLKTRVRTVLAQWRTRMKVDFFKQSE